MFKNISRVLFNCTFKINSFSKYLLEQNRKCVPILNNETANYSNNFMLSMKI